MGYQSSKPYMKQIQICGGRNVSEREPFFEQDMTLIGLEVNLDRYVLLSKCEFTEFLLNEWWCFFHLDTNF